MVVIVVREGKGKKVVSRSISRLGRLEERVKTPNFVLFVLTAGVRPTVVGIDGMKGEKGRLVARAVGDATEQRG